MSYPAKANLALISRILFRCWFMGAVLMVVTLLATQMFRVDIYRIHMRMFSLTEDQLDVTIYCFMGMMKLMVLFLFFIPWLAIKLTPVR